MTWNTTFKDRMDCYGLKVRLCLLLPGADQGQGGCWIVEPFWMRSTFRQLLAD